MKALNFLRFGFVLSLLSGCSTFSLDPLLQEDDIQAPTTQINLQYYIEELGKQLLLSSQPINYDQAIAVGTFLPLTSITNQDIPLTYRNPAGHQLQEGLVTFVSKSGLKVIEFKAMANIKLHENLDIMLSRNAGDLKKNINASYYLTGTYVQQDDLLLVNARLIELADNTIIAAATQQIPASFIWHQGKVIIKNDGIYRQSY